MNSDYLDIIMITHKGIRKSIDYCNLCGLRINKFYYGINGQPSPARIVVSAFRVTITDLIKCLNLAGSSLNDTFRYKSLLCAR